MIRQGIIAGNPIQEQKKPVRISQFQPRCHCHKVAQGKACRSALFCQDRLGIDQDSVATLRLPWCVYVNSSCGLATIWWVATLQRDSPEPDGQFGQSLQATIVGTFGQATQHKSGCEIWRKIKESKLARDLFEIYIYIEITSYDTDIHHSTQIIFFC